MELSILEYLDQIKTAPKQEYRNLAVVPLVSGYDSRVDYLLLEEALSGGWIEIIEKDREGSVAELKAVNRSERKILILDGEELVGAKQNRVVNTSILVQAQSTLVIPVSCVEQGRWGYSSTRFRSEKRVLSPSIRAGKSEQVRRSLRYSGTYLSDQVEIWDQIKDKFRRRGAHSRTSAMADIFEQDRPSIDEYARHFSVRESQVGAAFLINGEVAGMECLGRADSFSRVFLKLVESYALDAVERLDPEAQERASKDSFKAFLEALRMSKTEKHPSVGLGTDLRIDSPEVTGFALSLEEGILHLCVFGKEVRQTGNGSQSGMNRFSTRRRSRAFH